MTRRSRYVRGAGRSHWSFMFAEIAAYSFVVLVLTGCFLMWFYEPSMKRTVYGGAYPTLRGVRMSEAYASTLNLSFDVRGGLLVRQIHHWAALIFIAAVTLQLLRMFFTGAFRNPRLLNWLAWVGLLVLGMAAGVTGTLLPDDQLSGGSLSLIQGVVQSIPLIGTYLTLWLFGGDFPGEKIIPRMYGAHLIVSVLILALLALRYGLLRRHGHTRFPKQLPRPISRRTGLVALGALFTATCAVLVLLGSVAQINPIWLYGPFEPGSITSGAVPGWYMGFLDGGLRIMPNWEPTVFGHPLTLAVLVPALIVPGIFFTFLAAYPVIERRITGDRRAHDLLDRPRDAANRTALGASGVTFYGLLWAAASNDQIATHFGLSLTALTVFFRITVIAGPPLAFVVTRRLCLGLRQREHDEAEHGVETGVIRQLPNGGFEEVTRSPDRPSTDLAHGGTSG
ncbi:cytochrome bc1 complex cytochrome b subunit [Actinoallomurus sp. CA-150999]|uniref:cytochrome bc1 complex cytochrome b subunit n=1 Tax=Actinoallomurus sp. CA-150999 TaxID=3239887 RepID=UPI003D8B6FD9